MSWQDYETQKQDLPADLTAQEYEQRIKQIVEKEGI